MVAPNPYQKMKPVLIKYAPRDEVQKKAIKIFYSLKKTSGEGVTFTDISTLDAFSEDEAIAEWGGLSSFASKSSEIVSRYGK